MDKYEYKQKTREMLELMERGANKKAAEIADTIEWRRVKNPTILSKVSGIYESLKKYAKSYRILKYAYNHAKTSREILSRLCILAITTGNIDEAVGFYNEFKNIAPKDPNQYILRYKILKANRAPIEAQIEALVEFKKSEYIEEWAYELAKKYQEAGRISDCLDECDDLILWFSEGKYVYKAMELKMQYKPLTPLEQEKYDRRFDRYNDVTEELPVVSDIVEMRVQKQAEEPSADIAEIDINDRQTVEKTQDEVLKKLNEKGIVKTMMLDEALRSLLGTKKNADENKKGCEEKEEGQEHKKDLSGVEAAIDMDMAEKFVEKAGEPDQSSDAFDRDLEELTAEPPDEKEESEAKPEAVTGEENTLLPKDIQRMIDEIEGVIPMEIELEPILPEKKIDKGPQKNVGELAEQLRIDDTDAFAKQEKPSEEYKEKQFLDEQEEEVFLDEYDEEEFSDEYDEEEFLGEYEESAAEEEFPAGDEYEEYAAEEEFPADDEKEEAKEDALTVEAKKEEKFSGTEEKEEEPSKNQRKKADFDYKDMAATLEEEFRPNPEDAKLPDDREIPDEEEDILDIMSTTKQLSRRETAKLHATGKTGPIPVDEISGAVSMPNTGFVIHGRYDLESQSGIGTRAGLTQEQKKLFSYFVPVRGMSDQLVNVLERDRKCTKRAGTSKTGNILIIGGKGTGKTVLAVDVVKAIQKQRNIVKGKVAIVTGETLNKKRVGDIFDKLYGGALIIEKASKMHEKTVCSLNKVMESDTGELLVILEDQRKPLDRLLSISRDFRRKFTSRLEVPDFTNDELVTFGQTYAKENGYRIDDMGILALYSRIDSLQREDHAVTVAEVKTMIDGAIEHATKVSAKILVRKVFRRNTDEADRILLSEKDFNA